MCLKTPDVKAPKAPSMEKSIEERKTRVRDEEERRRRAAMQGIQSTILTGPGASGGGAQMGAFKTKTGQ